MDQGYHQYYFAPTSPSEIYQFCFDYKTWSMCNQNIYAASPAYQELNQPQLSQNFPLESVDLTCEPDEPPQLRLSPTQAEVFKLVCKNCKRNFTSKKRLQNHLVNCKEIIKDMKFFPCPKCCKVFKRQSSLKKHDLQYHKTTLGGHKKVEPQAMPIRSIFHNVQLLAISDCSNKF
jgi:Zinc finger, C2H2 type